MASSSSSWDDQMMMGCRKKDPKKMKKSVHKGPYVHKDALLRKKTPEPGDNRLAGGPTVSTRDEDPRIDFLHKFAEIPPKAGESADKFDCPYQHEAWTVRNHHLVEMVMEDIDAKEPYTKVYRPTVNLLEEFQVFLERQNEFYVSRGVSEVRPVAFQPYLAIDETTGLIRIVASEKKEYKFPKCSPFYTKVSDNVLSAVAAPCGKINFQDEYHQALRNSCLEKIKKYEEKEQERELKRQNSHVLGVVPPQYQPGVKGTPKVPRVEPTLQTAPSLNRIGIVPTPVTTPPSTPVVRKAVFKWPSPPSDPDTGPSTSSKSSSNNKKTLGAASSKSESSGKSKPQLVLKFRKSVKRSYEAMMQSRPASAPKAPARPKRVKVSTPRTVPSIASISGAEELKKLEALKMKMTPVKTIVPPVVIADPRIEMEKKKILEKERLEKLRQIKLEEATDKLRKSGVLPPLLPNNCTGSLNPARMNNGEPYVAAKTVLKPPLYERTKPYAYTNGNNGFGPVGDSRPFRIPKRAPETVLSMPDLIVNDEGYSEPSLSHIPQGSLNPLHSSFQPKPVVSSVREKINKANGIFSTFSVSVDQVDSSKETCSPPKKPPVLIPVASDVEDDDDVIDIHAPDDFDLDLL